MLAYGSFFFPRLSISLSAYDSLFFIAVSHIRSGVNCWSNAFSLVLHAKLRIAYYLFPFFCSCLSELPLMSNAMNK